MSGFFDDQTLDLPCPGCGHVNPKTVGWLKTHKDMVCNGCHETVHLKSDDLLKGIRESENAIRNFGR